MRAHFPSKPYEITKGMWDEYEGVRRGGSMNMMGHHLIGYFCQGDAYSQARKHFEEESNEDPLTIGDEKNE